MLSAVLRSEVAIQMSIRIMNTFVEMRRFISNNALLFERISNVELKQLEYQKNTDEKLEQIFTYISEHEESNQKIFFDGQIYDAFSLIVGLIRKAEREITPVSYTHLDVCKRQSVYEAIKKLGGDFLSLKPKKHSDLRKIQDKMKHKASKMNTKNKLPPYTMIVCEGVKTEPLYLKGFVEKINQQYKICLLYTSRCV